MPDAPLKISKTNKTLGKKLVLLDGNSLLYRGFFAMRALTTSSGQHTNAIFSLTMMLLTLIESQKPDIVICAWDVKKKTFRHEEYEQYKAQRQAPPTELIEQGPLAREMVDAFGITQVEAPGYEADDVIGTLARRGRDTGYEILIVTGDLDDLQLVEPGVQVLTTVRGVTDTVIYDEAAVHARYGLTPAQLTDYRALKGDSSDNIPGVPGIGEKTATQLLQQFDTIENLIERVEEVKQPRVQASLREHSDQMRLAKRLATILCDVPLPDFDLAALDAAPYAPRWSEIRALFERLEFRALLKRVPEKSASVISLAAPMGVGAGASTPAPAESAASASREAGEANIDADDYDPFADDAGETPAVAPAAPETIAVVYDFRDVDSDAARRAMIDACRAAGHFALRLHTTVEEGALDARLLGVAVSPGVGAGWYVALAGPHPPAPIPVSGEGKGESTKEAISSLTPPLPERGRGQGGGGDDLGGLFSPPPATPTPLPAAATNATLSADLVALLEDPAVGKTAHDAKSDIAVLERYGVCLRGLAFDTELAAYLLNAGRRSGYPLDAVAGDYAQRTLAVLDKKERKALDANPEAAFAHDKSEALKGAEAIGAVRVAQEPRLVAEELTDVLQMLDLPITPILAEMELAGLAVDVPTFNRVSAQMQTQIEELEREIYAIAGGEFAITSIKQLQEVLFERLKIPATKKTKTGYSTGAEVLEELSTDYPIVGLILKHRELMKLKGTYTDAMPLLVRPDTGRIHTSLNQTVAATGRLSSSNPNLQNIPIRTAIGREIRRAFVAPPGLTLLSADYSQIELRLFAHVSKDPELVAAFSSGEDIHVYTASKVYNVPVAEVTADMRRAAKTVNYAVIYGISEFALGRRLGISMTAAKELKTSYFARFPGVRRFLDETVAFAKEHGYVKTLFGRRRQIPDINSRVFQFRQAAERAAANMPIQGSSADIMKLAMVRVYEMLRREKMEARLLLQVHDELLFEAPPHEIGTLAARVHEAMSRTYPLAVSLDVEVKTGATWADVTPVEDFDAIGVDGA